jgi:hypothetical protein
VQVVEVSVQQPSDCRFRIELFNQHHRWPQVLQNLVSFAELHAGRNNIASPQAALNIRVRP